MLMLHLNDYILKVKALQLSSDILAHKILIYHLHVELVC